MAMFSNNDSYAYNSFEYQYANNPQFKEHYDKLFGDDPHMKAGQSFSDKIKIWADSMYEREDKVIETITGTAQKAVGIGQNLALLGIAGVALFVYFKYFKGAKK